MIPTQRNNVPRRPVRVGIKSGIDRCEMSFSESEFTEAQGQGLGAFILVDALRRALQVSEQIGIRAVEVDALDESARNFYLKFGFRSLLDDPNHLFPPMHEIRKLKLPRL